MSTRSAFGSISDAATATDPLRLWEGRSPRCFWKRDVGASRARHRGYQVSTGRCDNLHGGCEPPGACIHAISPRLSRPCRLRNFIGPVPRSIRLDVGRSPPGPGSHLVVLRAHHDASSPWRFGAGGWARGKGRVLPRSPPGDAGDLPATDEGAVSSLRGVPRAHRDTLYKLPFSTSLVVCLALDRGSPRTGPSRAVYANDELPGIGSPLALSLLARRALVASLAIPMPKPRRR